MFPSLDVPIVVKLTETKGRMVGARACGEGGVGSYFMSIELQFFKIKNF